MTGLLEAGSAVLGCGNVAAMLLVARSKRAGWLLGIGLQVIWIPYDVLTRQYGLLLISAVAVPAYARGWLRSRPAAGSPPDSSR